MRYFKSFADEMRKIAAAEGLAAHGAEIAGLGILAYPSAKKMTTGREASNKTKHLTELGGLGVLAAPSAHAIYRHFKPVASKIK